MKEVCHMCKHTINMANSPENAVRMFDELSRATPLRNPQTVAQQVKDAAKIR